MHANAGVFSRYAQNVVQEIVDDLVAD
jgi:hypothetical protein